MVALKQQDYCNFAGKRKQFLKTNLVILDNFLLHTIKDEREAKSLFELLKKRNEQNRNKTDYLQRDPDH